MNKIVLAGIAAAAILLIALVTIPLAFDEAAEAKRIKRFITTESHQSSMHRAVGHDSHQAIEILPPMENLLYRGTLSYTASKDVDVLVYHKVTDETTGAIHEVGGIKYAVEKAASGKEGNASFVGDAVLFHLSDSEPYTVTVSIMAQARAVKGELPVMKPVPEYAEYNSALNPRQITYPVVHGFNDLHIGAIRHLTPEDPSRLQVLVHHHCKVYDDGTAACLLFPTGMRDQDKPYGIEYVITAEQYNELPDEEKRYWHYHKTEFPRADAFFPDLTGDELEELKPILDETYGKVYYFWNYGDKYPVGEPFVLVVQDLPQVLQVTTPVYATLRGDNAVTALPLGAHWAAGGDMTYISTTADGRLALTTSGEDERVYAFDTRMGEVIATVPVGKTPRGVKISLDGKWALVANEGSGSVSAIDLATWKVAKEIPVGSVPHNSVFSPDGRWAYVTIQGGDAVAVIDMEVLEKMTAIPVEKRPHNLDITPDGKHLFVANIDTSDVAVIDLTSQEIVKRIPVSTGHHGIDVSPDGRWVYVSGIGADKVNVIDTETLELVKQITVGLGPHGLRTSPDSSKLYVTVTGTNEIVVIDTGSLEVTEHIPTGKVPFWIAVPGNP